MGSCFGKPTCDYAIAQIGMPCGKTNKYSEEMDAIDFYNFPKNGVANSCKIFVDNCVLHGCTDPTYEDDPEGAKWTALYMLNEPSSDNDGAGCAQSVRMFQSMGEWYTDPQEFERGDEIYFKRNSAVSKSNPLGVYHTGIIVDWGTFDELDGEDGFKVVEGNTTYNGESGMVGVKFYTFGDSRIAGAGRPRYDAWAEDESTDTEPKPEPEKPDEPATEPDEPQGTLYVVSVNSWLNVRNGCGKDHPVVDKLYNDETVMVYEIRGWGRISNDMDLWVSMDYLK